MGERKPGIFVLHANSGRLTAGVTLIALSSLLIVFIASMGDDMLYEYVLGPLVMLGYSLGLLLRGSQTRTYIIDSNESMYEFYIGDVLVYRGHVHNIYIRLTAVRSGGSENYYTITLNGFMIDEQNLTGSVT